MQRPGDRILGVALRAQQADRALHQSTVACWLPPLRLGPEFSVCVGVRPINHLAPEGGRPCQRGDDRTPQPGQNGTTLSGVDSSSDVTEFLSSRRARITPEQAGLTSYRARLLPGPAPRRGRLAGRRRRPVLQTPGARQPQRCLRAPPGRTSSPEQPADSARFTLPGHLAPSSELRHTTAS